MNSNLDNYNSKQQEEEEEEENNISNVNKDVQQQLKQKKDPSALILSSSSIIVTSEEDESIWDQSTAESSMTRIEVSTKPFNHDMYNDKQSIDYQSISARNERTAISLNHDTIHRTNKKEHGNVELYNYHDSIEDSKNDDIFSLSSNLSSDKSKAGLVIQCSPLKSIPISSCSESLADSSKSAFSSSIPSSALGSPHRHSSQVSGTVLKFDDPSSSSSLLMKKKSNIPMTSLVLHESSSTITKVKFRLIGLENDNETNTGDGGKFLNPSLIDSNSSKNLQSSIRHNPFDSNNNNNNLDTKITNNNTKDVISVIEQDVVLPNSDNSDRYSSFVEAGLSQSSSPELPETSRLTFAGLDSTLPLAVDNERFFALSTTDEVMASETCLYIDMDPNIDIDQGQEWKDGLDPDSGSTAHGMDPNNIGGYGKLLVGAFQHMHKMRRHQSVYWNEANDEVFSDKNNRAFFLWRWLAYLWRAAFQIFIRLTSDRINTLYICRDSGHSIQEHFAWVSSYESYVLGGIVKEFDLNEDLIDGTRKPNNHYHMHLAFKNRNTSRVLATLVFHFRRWAYFYHLSTGMTFCRLFGVLSLFFNTFAFPPTENDTLHKFDTWYSSKIRRLFRSIVYWIRTTRVHWLFGLESFDTKDFKERAGMNLAAEVHGVEAYNMEFTGCATYGRIRTTKFRQEHRLTIDESIVRSFMSNSIGTMVHNGIEHVLRCLGNHWNNMLFQENGNFAHQRFEQLYPFDVLRVHIPEVLCTLSGIRGRNLWDCTVLGPFVRKLQSLDPGRIRIVKKDDSTQRQEQPREGLEDAIYGADNEQETENRAAEIWFPCRAGQKMVNDIKLLIVPNVCGNIPSRMVPFIAWLDAIHDSFEVLANEALALRDFVETVDLGIKLGYEILRLVNWSVPSDDFMAKSIVYSVLDKDINVELPHITNAFLRGTQCCTGHSDIRAEIPRDLIISALGKLSAKDERTLRECIKHKFVTSVNSTADLPAGKLLLRRAITLLEREIRRRAIDERIRELSRGPSVNTTKELVQNRWYWIQLNTSNVPNELTNNNNTVRLPYVTLTSNGHANGSDSWMAVSLLRIKTNETGGSLFLCRDVNTDANYIFPLSKGSSSSMNDLIDPNYIHIKQYVPIAEAISRAQEAFMTIELDFCKRFSYNTFMEFGSTANDKSLRNRLRRLATLSQVHCSELDKARLNVLTETMNSVQRKRRHQMKKNSVRNTVHITPTNNSVVSHRSLEENVQPQNMLILGGGPIGLFSALHCIHNVILTGGQIKLYEARDAFDQEASTFERAQIVRLDPRLVAMLRFHLGTGFEDVFSPCRGESTAHLGNSLPGQGFVEVAIKRLESMLLDEVINLRSKGLLQYFSDSKIICDSECSSFHKKGNALKIGDLLCDKSNVAGNTIVRDFEYQTRLKKDDLVVGDDYDVIHPREKRVRCYRLVRTDADFDWYMFSPHDSGVKDLTGSFNQLPPIYRKGYGRTEPTNIILESATTGQYNLLYDDVKDTTFQLDVSKSHVILALGKPNESKHHLAFTTSEPYGICCIEGLKVSKGMHNFGETRFGTSLKDDYHTLHTDNTRIVGDFMKSVRITSIIDTMNAKLRDNAFWRFHFDQLAASMCDKIPAIHAQLMAEMSILASTSFKRRRLQTRYFELGNTYYLGMEFPREYHTWKIATVLKIAPDKCDITPEPVIKIRENLQKVLASHIDRLWYDATLDVLRQAEVYEYEGKRRIPRFYTIDSPFEQKLGDLAEMDSFRIFRRTYRVFIHEGSGCTQIVHQHENSAFRIPTMTYVLDLATNSKKTLGELDRDDHFEPIDTFEILWKLKSSSIVRTSGGYVSKMPHDVRVGIVSDLSRAPDGYSESKVALATFPVCHFVNHRTLRINRSLDRRGRDGFVTAHIGDAQASPHFMRYSGLTGGGINAMSLNNLIGQTLRGVDFENRIQRYAFETNWSSGEVIVRGTGSCYGQDGFLRPGFSYDNLVSFLFDKVLELVEIRANDDVMLNLSRDWKTRIAASVVPRGLENDTLFCSTLCAKFESSIQAKITAEANSIVGGLKLSPYLWNTVSEEKLKIKDTNVSLQEAVAYISVLSTPHNDDVDDVYRCKIKLVSSALRVVMITLKEIVNHSLQLRLDNKRKSSELYNQPKSVDTIVNHFALDAQILTNSLTRVCALGTAALGLHRSDDVFLLFVSCIFAMWFFHASYEVLFHTIRYRRRNLTYVREFIDTKLSNVIKSSFSLMTKDQRDLSVNHNPFDLSLKASVIQFLNAAEYYNADDASITAFRIAYNNFNTSDKSERRIVYFMRQLIVDFITDSFQENSYLQEKLVDVYKELLAMRNLDQQKAYIGMSGAEKLFNQLTILEEALQKGSVAKTRILFCECTSQSKLVKETKAVKVLSENLSSYSGSSPMVHRCVRDLTELHQSFSELQTTAAVIICAFAAMVSAVAILVFRLIELLASEREELWILTANTVLNWTALLWLVGFGMIAFMGLVTRSNHLDHLRCAIRQTHGKTARLAPLAWIALVEKSIITPSKISVVVFSVVVSLWLIVASTIDMTKSEEVTPMITGSVLVVSFLSDIFTAVVEFQLRYRLDPCLGEAIGDAFRPAIDHLHQAFAYHHTGLEFETVQDLNKETWEYVAREFLHKYRFDTILDVNRLGSIFQFIQSGNMIPDTLRKLMDPLAERAGGTAA